MAKLAWGEYRPDVSDLSAGFTRLMRNCVPRGDGVGPFKNIAPFTQALPARCRGYFVSYSPSDGSVLVFAGTEDRLYRLDNTTLDWTDVSLAGNAYTALSADAHWSFAQFNSVIVATQKNVVMQSYTIGSSSAFANLAGSPPQSGWISVVGRFLVAGDLLSNPNRLQWSGLNAITTWTSGTTQSDFQDLPDGGRVRCQGEIAGDVGMILQDGAIRRMTYAPGSAVIFQIEKVTGEFGVLSPFSLTFAAGSMFFASTKGFCRMTADGAATFIGEERVDRSFLGKHDSSAPTEVLSLARDTTQPQLVIGAADPQRNLVMWVYKSQAGLSGLFDRGFIYHWSRQRWSPIEVSGEYIAQVAQPGLTLEALDAIAPGALTIVGAADNGAGLIRIEVADTSSLTTGDMRTVSGVTGTTEANGSSWVLTVIDGTHFDLDGSAFVNAYVSGGVLAGSIDEMTISLDELSTASLPAISAVNASHEMGFFSGDTLEAELETAEQAFEGQRMTVNGIRPITDAGSVFGSAVARDNLNAAGTAGDESEMDDDGYCPLLDEGRYVRARIRIPAAVAWNFASGVEADAQPAGVF